MKLRKIGLSLLVFNLFLLSFSSLALAADQAQDISLPQDVSQNIITAIKIVGNKHISDQEILNQVSTQPGDSIDQEQLKQDMQSIFDLGYFFDIKVNFKHHDGGVMLVFEVIENPKLAKIEVKGNNKISTTKIKEILGFKTEEILNVNQINQKIREVNEYYQKQGYILAEVVNVTIKNKDELHLEIKEGILNKIIISGNQVTKDYVIRRELDMQPGDVFNAEEMKQDLRKIYNLGYFKDVKPKLKRVESQPQAVDLEINVTERKTGTFSIGGGYSSESGLTGLVNVKKDNLFGTGQQAKLNMEFGGKKETYELGYYTPWTLGTETSIDFNLYRRETEEDRVGGDITVGRPIAEFTKGYAKLTAESITGDDIDGVKRNRSITLKTIRDTRKNILNPRTGSRSEAAVEKAGILGGDNDFTKYRLDLRKYLPSFEDNAWAFRLKLGESQGTLPYYEEYSLAGMDGIRGYNEDYYSSDNNPVENGFEGNSLVLGTLEYRVKLMDKITGISFFDAGRTFSDHINADDLTDVNYSLGLGLRFTTPIGQLGVDYGYAPAGNLDKKTHLSFKIGNSF